MGVLDFLAGLAAVVLALELLVGTAIFAAVCVGLWFGLRFADRKSGGLLEKVNGYIKKYRPYEKRGLGYAALPVILAHQWGRRIGTTASTLVEDARRP